MEEQEKVKEERGLVQYHSRDGQEIRLSFEVVRKYLVSGRAEFVTDAEMMLYMGMCKARGLNPFKKDCYLVKYTQDDPASTIVSIDYYRSRAKAQPDCTGWKNGIVVQVGPRQLEEREGTILLEGEKLVGGWYCAKPKGWEEEKRWTVSLGRYVKKTREGKLTRFWQEDSQPEMIAKVAESQGLRRTWPDEFAKLYIEEEIVQGVPIQEEHLKIPQAIKEKGDADSTMATTASHTRKDALDNRDAAESSDRGNGMPTDSTTSAPIKKTSPKKQKELTPEERLADLINWLQNSGSEAEILAQENYVSKNLKGLNSKDQLDICKLWNQRRKQILAKAKKEGA